MKCKTDTEYVYQAYAAIAQGEGLRGRDFMQLIGMLSADFSPLASDMVLKIFNKLDHEVRAGGRAGRRAGGQAGRRAGDG